MPGSTRSHPRRPAGETGDGGTLRSEVQCSRPGCRLALRVIAPLIVSGQTIARSSSTARPPTVSGGADETLATGLSRLLSSQLELYEVEVQRQLAAEAQVRALKAQIHPHFIFNVLNTIARLRRRPAGGPHRGAPPELALAAHLPGSVPSSSPCRRSWRWCASTWRSRASASPT